MSALYNQFGLSGVGVRAINLREGWVYFGPVRGTIERQEMIMAKRRETTVTLRLNNNLTDRLAVIVEPWCEHYSLPASSTFDVIAKGPEDAFLEIDCELSRLTIYGWSGSVITVFKDGKELLPGAGVGDANPGVPDPQTKLSGDANPRPEWA
jgi:hypothetical protein